MRTLLFSALTFCFSTICALSDTASKAAADYYRTLKEKDYPAAAKMFDPAALKSFRGTMLFMTELDEDQRNEVLEVFFGHGATKESVEKMSDTEFFAGFFKGVMGQAEEIGGVDFGELQVLGEVPEGADVVHVVTRNKVGVGEIKVESLEVISFKKTEAGWKALLNGEMTGMAAQLKNSFGK